MHFAVRPVLIRIALASALCAALVAPAVTRAAESRDRDRREAAEARRPAKHDASLDPIPGANAPASILPVSATAVVNFADLARREALRPAGSTPPVRVLVPNELNEDEEEPAPAVLAPPSESSVFTRPPQALVASPSPASSFAGLDDVPMADSSYIVIPPDVGGAVGLTKVMESCNNNYRIRDKATGATLQTLGTATFWNNALADKTLLNQLTDPHTVYDPINNRWIATMQTTNASGHVMIGVSQTSDPSGAWFLYDTNTGARLDYPILGFNKNWIAVTINKYTAAGAFQNGITIVANYPQARAGTLASTTTFNQSAGSHFCSSPCATLSATEDTLFVVTHLSSTGATYAVDVITGSATPTYTTGGTSTRPGGGWAQPSGQVLPQSAPNSGASSCGATPCKLEAQDSQVRSEAVYRVDATTGRGFIYYAQSIGLPSAGLTHTAVQWTKITPSTTPAFADGGRIEDATATATNGGKWYSHPHIAVNSLGDLLVGFTQFSSAQHPSAGYAYHDHTDGAGVLRDPLVYKAGEDYYHKDFGSGRNRWGDFTKAQVDPSDDKTMWVLNEYGKSRVSTDDGTSGSNGSRWATYWASTVLNTTTFTVNASAGANGTITPAGAVVVNQAANQSFTITPAACYHVADVQVDGASAGAVTGYTFTNVQANHTIAATFAINTYSVTASAGANGTISPNGLTNYNCGGNASYAITPAACYHVADVLVDGVSQGAVTSFTFTNLQASHSITASFAINSFTVTASAGANGTISPNGATPVNCGATQAYTITPAACWHVADVLVDGASVGAVTNYSFTNVQANHTIAASFALDTFTITAGAGAGGTITPNGSVPVNCGASASFTIAPAANQHVIDVLVDGSSVGAVTNYGFTNVQANHSIAASFAPDSFALGVTVVGQGAVARAPSLPFYEYGSAVSLTATPDPGWGFSGWTGSVTSVANPLGITILGSTALTATFADTTRPVVQVLAPPANAVLTIGTNATIGWNATDNVGVTAIDVLLSRSGNSGPFDSLAVGLANSGSYSWLVTGPATTDAFVQVRAHDAAGSVGSAVSDSAFVIAGAAGVGGEGGPLAFALSRVVPNPAHASARVQFGMPRAASIRVSVLDVQGREVAVLAQGEWGPGVHTVAWSDPGARPGLYLVRMTAPGHTLVQRFVHL